jgi:DNA-binding response OmpR family regulator
MKVLVLGNDLIVERLNNALGVDDIQVETPVTDLSFGLESVKAEQYDLVIVDSLNDNVEQVCNFFYSLDCTPVSLMISEKLEDWKCVANFRVDGFLSKEASDRELRTRVKATCRRNQKTRLRA